MLQTDVTYIQTHWLIEQILIEIVTENDQLLIGKPSIIYLFRSAIKNIIIISTIEYKPNNLFKTNKTILLLQTESVKVTKT